MLKQIQRKSLNLNHRNLCSSSIQKNVWDAMRDFVPFAQLKYVKNAHGRVLLFKSTNSTKSRKASHIHSEGWSEDTGISETQNRQTRGGSSFLTENIPSIVKLSVAYIFIKSKLCSLSFNASFFLSIFLINERSKKFVIFTFKLNMPIFMLHLDLLNFLLLGYQKTIVAIF